MTKSLVLTYFAIAAAFPVAATLSFRKGGLLLLTITSLLAMGSLLAVGLWEESMVPRNETDVGVPILLALVPPLVTAAVIRWLGKSKSPLWAQWVLGLLAWIVTLVPVGFAALLLNWVTF
jgi:hypothetical protein